MAVMCDCGLSCRGSCASGGFPDNGPGEVQRMEKTKPDRGVWASSRALIFHEEFPSLLNASRQRRGAMDMHRTQTKFHYNWKQWISDLQALLEHSKLPPSCERMVRVLHYQYGYELDRMEEIVPQLAKSVIELEFRRSEKERKIADSPISDSDSNNETTLMTRVRSAISDKQKRLAEVLRQFIRRCYHSVVATSVPSAIIAPVTPPPQITDNRSTPDGSVSAHVQATPYDFNPFDVLLGWDENNSDPLFPPETAPLSGTLPDENTNQCDSSSLLVEHVPGLNPGVMFNHRSDPLFAVMTLAGLKNTTQAVLHFKSILQCDVTGVTSEMSKMWGVTHWYYMFLRLGEEVRRRELAAEKRGQELVPSTKRLLCGLDSVFEDIESERWYGQFTPQAKNTLNKFVAMGNYAAMATKGLLLLGGEVEVGGASVYSYEYGDDIEAREEEGLDLILQAMDHDVWTVPRLTVQLIMNREVRTRPATVRKVVEAIRQRAEHCSITSFHLGSLLAYEMAPQVGYECNVHFAKQALRSCLDGVYVPADIRLHCMRKLGRLVTFGVGGRGADLDMAVRVLRKGVEADDAFCIAHLANVRLRQKEPEAAADLFRALFKKEDREVFISARPDETKIAWETYRILVLEQHEAHFLSHVRTGACLPNVMKRERAANDYGHLMVIELHESGLS